MENNYSAQASNLEWKIEIIEELLETISRKKYTLQRRLAECKSRGFIDENRITFNDVELLEGHGKHGFSEFIDFGKWLSENSERPWCEFNGMIFSRDEALAGDLAPSRATAHLDHVPLF